MLLKRTIVLILSSALLACTMSEEVPEIVLIGDRFAYCEGPNYENNLRGTGICLPDEQEGVACQLPDKSIHIFRSYAECLESGGTDEFRVR